jgi:hypothetical protein
MRRGYYRPKRRSEEITIGEYENYREKILNYFEVESPVNTKTFIDWLRKKSGFKVDYSMKVANLFLDRLVSQKELYSYRVESQIFYCRTLDELEKIQGLSKVSIKKIRENKAHEERKGKVITVIKILLNLSDRYTLFSDLVNLIESDYISKADISSILVSLEKYLTNVDTSEGTMIKLKTTYKHNTADEILELIFTPSNKGKLDLLNRLEYRILERKLLSSFNQVGQSMGKYIYNFAELMQLFIRHNPNVNTEDFKKTKLISAFLELTVCKIDYEDGKLLDYPPRITSHQGEPLTPIYKIERWKRICFCTSKKPLVELKFDREAGNMPIREKPNANINSKRGGKDMASAVGVLLNEENAGKYLTRDQIVERVGNLNLLKKIQLVRISGDLEKAGLIDIKKLRKIIIDRNDPEKNLIIPKKIRLKEEYRDMEIKDILDLVEMAKTQELE